MKTLKPVIYATAGALCVWLGLFLISPLVLQPTAPPPQPRIIQFGPMPNCEDVLLRNPGGMHSSLATICIDEFGWYEKGTQRLREHEYERIIQPVKDSLLQVARERGLIDKKLDWGY